MLATRQLPVVQPPERQSWPLAHWLSCEQAAQLLLRQTWPLLQVVLLWQLPATHSPPSQMRPVPQTASLVPQPPQTWLAVQIWPVVVQSLLSWQVPITQLFDTQM